MSESVVIEMETGVISQVKYTLTKEGDQIILRGSDGSVYSVTDSDTIQDVPAAVREILIAGGYVADQSYVHTDNNYTTAEKTKLADIEAGAQVNVIQTVKRNGVALVPDADKAVDIAVPTKTGDLDNDSDFQTGEQVAAAVEAEAYDRDMADQNLAIMIASVPAKAGEADGSMKNTLSSAGAKGWQFSDTQLVSGDDEYRICPVGGDFSEIEVGDRVSMKAGYSWNFAGAVVAVDPDGSTYGVSCIVVQFAKPSSEWPENFVPAEHEMQPSGYFWLPDKPDAGAYPIGYGALAVGYGNKANEMGAIAGGAGNLADGRYSAVFGMDNEGGYGALIQGNTNKTTGLWDMAVGVENEVSGDRSCAIGGHNSATGNTSFAEGHHNAASGDYTHAEGYNTEASGAAAHAEGYFTKATGDRSHAEGYYTEATGVNAHAEGVLSKATNTNAHAEGGETAASGTYAHAEGYQTAASGSRAHAEGNITKAMGNHSHAEGNQTKANGEQAHAEGYKSVAGARGHAEGNQTEAGEQAHAEGSLTKAHGVNAHAEGNGTQALGVNTHTEGLNTKALGVHSHAEGRETIAGSACQHVQGKFNREDSAGAYADIVGWGSNENDRRNISALTTDGTQILQGDLVLGAGPDSTGGVRITAQQLQALLALLQ